MLGAEKMDSKNSQPSPKGELLVWWESLSQGKKVVRQAIGKTPNAFTYMPMEHTLTRSHSCTTHTYIIHHCCHHLHPHHHHHHIHTHNFERACNIKWRKSPSNYRFSVSTQVSHSWIWSHREFKCCSAAISTIGDVKPVSVLLSALGVSSAKPLR